MKKILSYIIMASVAVFCLTGCHQQDVTDFTFFMNAVSVTEGEPLALNLYLESGEPDGYQFKGHVSLIVSGDYEDVETAYRFDGKDLVDGSYVSFVNRRLQLALEDLKAGTYRCSVTLEKYGIAKTVACICVIQEKGGSGGGGGGGGVDPQEDVHVADFTIPVEDGGTMSMYVGDVIRHKVIFSPVNATDTNLEVSVSNSGAVLVSYEDSYLVISALSAGECGVSVTAESGKGIRKTFNVKVAKRSVPVQDFTVPTAGESGAVELKHGSDLRFTPVITPSDATAPAFVVTSSNESVVTAWYVDGEFVIRPVAPGRASVTFSADGVTKSVSVLVYKEVTVTVEFVEVTPSELQIKTKTEPCSIMFSSDSDIAFPEPITWSVTVKSVITLTGHDTKTYTSKKTVSFYGNREAEYDIAAEVLVPSYNIWKSNAYSYTLSLALILNNPLDKDLWHVTIDNKYLTQDAAIKRYIIEYIQ